MLKVSYRRGGSEWVLIIFTMKMTRMFQANQLLNLNSRIMDQFGKSKYQIPINAIKYLRDRNLNSRELFLEIPL